MKGNTAGLFLFLALSVLPFGCTFSRPLPVGTSAPDFELPALNSGQEKVRLSDVNRDHPVLLVFWTTWCPNCNAEIPDLKRINEDFAAKGLKVLTVDVEEDRNQVEAFVAEKKIRYPVLLDTDGKTANLYGLSGIPVTLFLEKGGEILYYGFQLPENIEQLLEKKETSKV